MWNAIKSRFGGNDESKKMQKYILKQQFEGFTVSNIDGIHKGYERFQSLLSQLEIHGAGVSTEDANQKFLDLYLLLGSTASSSNLQNVAFVSENTSRDDDVSTLMVFPILLDIIQRLNQVHHIPCLQVQSKMKKFLQETGRMLQFDAKGTLEKIKMEANGKKEESKALVTVDGESVDWTTHSEDMKIMLYG
ncbi:hypothetical protein Tco_0318085 [Tanacetum coccineum]